jgi:hypothetical protein
MFESMSYRLMQSGLELSQDLRALTGCGAIAQNGLMQQQRGDRSNGRAHGGSGRVVDG